MEKTGRVKVVRQGRTADRAAEFERLYRECYDQVYNYVSYRMAGSSAAEDVVAEAFLKAARAFDRFDPSRAKFSTWVIAIARNCVVSYWRKERPADRIDDIAEGAFAVEDDHSGLEGDVAEARRLLATLEDTERELVYMKYCQGMRNVEIARELDMNESTVATRLQRALAKMRTVAKEG